MAERNPKDINKKLRSLTKEQAESLYQQLNSCYPDKKAPAKKTAAKKAPAKKKASK